MAQRLTKEQFIAASLVEGFVDVVRYEPYPCYCGFSGCRGWIWVPNGFIPPTRNKNQEK